MAIPSPNSMFRIVVNFCLVGAGGSAIWRASHIGPGYDRFGWAHELTLFFLFGLVAFVLFFVEYRMVQKLSKRELNPQLGYVQSLGCFLLLLGGIGAICYTQQRPLTPYNPALPDSILRIIYIFGHTIFLGNIIWSYVREASVS
jgi:hypothetical protein